MAQAIDTERKGYIDADRLAELLTGDSGTPFRDKEVVGAWRDHARLCYNPTCLRLLLFSAFVVPVPAGPVLSLHCKAFHLHQYSVQEPLLPQYYYITVCDVS